jgi:putative peptidoglycan lipid II flippase
MAMYRAFATVGGLTLVSRILGFCRDIVFAALVGAGPIAEAFVVAFRFPNLFRRWFGEGAFNAAFVPLFTKKLEAEGQAPARAFAAEAMAGLAFIVALLSALCMAAMPWLMVLLAPGFQSDPTKFDLTVDMSRIAFPYLLCMSLVALLSGVLNALGKFVESSAVSVVLNLTLMGAMGVAWMLGYGNDPRTGYVLAWGIFVAGVLQLILLLDGARRAGMLPRLVRPVWNEDVKRLVTLGVPGIIAGGATQINIVIGGMIASFEAGAPAWLFYADRLYELPLALIGIALGVVLLPDISRRLRAGDEAGVMDSQNRALELAMLLTIPAAVALAIVPREIISVLFERGAFTARDTQAVAVALAVFALGLPAFVLIKVFSPAYFAREDTRTPMRYAAASLAVNTLGSVGLFVLFKQWGWPPHVGIALATTAGGWINALLLWRTLRRRGHYIADKRVLYALAMACFASVAMGAALWWLADALRGGLASGGAVLMRAGALALLLGAGAAVYGVCVVATGALRLSGLKRALRRGG